jgi:hypothetical protein
LIFSESEDTFAVVAENMKIFSHSSPLNLFSWGSDGWH